MKASIGMQPNCYDVQKKAENLMWLNDVVQLECPFVDEQGYQYLKRELKRFYILKLDDE